MRLSFDGISIELCWGLTYVPPDPSWTSEAHSHTVYECHIVVGGKGINYRYDEALALYPDILYLAPPHEVHAQQSDQDSPLSLYFLGFQLTFDDKRSPLPSIYMEMPTIRKSLEELLLLKEQPSGLSSFKFEMRLLELLWEILEPVIHISSQDRQEKSFYSSRDYVDKVIAYTEIHLLKHPSIKELAASCNITARHLTRIFSKETNLSINEYVQKERFSWALSQLRNTSLSIQEISDMLHFSSTQYFTQWFKKFALKTPLEFRKEQNS